MTPHLLLVDISGLAYAALYSPGLSRLAHEGKPTGGIHGAINSLFARMDECPEAVPMVLWDRRAVWRHEMHAEYKSNRNDTPEKVEIKKSLHEQVPVIQLVLTALGVPQISCGGAEADDLAGVICREIDPTWNIEMMTRDTDWFQSLEPHIQWYSPLTQKLVTLSELQNPDNGLPDGHFLSTWEYLQAKALAGDTSDVIPGIDKVGMKTAVKAMRAHGGTIESFWAAVDSGAFVPKGVLLERLASQMSRDIYARNIKLMDWREAPPLDLGQLALSAGDPQWNLFDELCADYGLARVPKRARTVMARLTPELRESAVQAVDSALHAQWCQPTSRRSARSGMAPPAC